MQLKNGVIAIPCSKDYFNIYIYKDSALKVLYNYRVLAFAENDTSTFDLVKVARDLSWDTNLFGVNQYWITLNEDGTGLSRFKSQSVDKNVNTFFVFGYR
jgi:hypothetical protein